MAIGSTAGRRTSAVIKRRAVFVLGAGAHVPYGFPIGDGLLGAILNLLPPNQRAETDFSRLVLDQYRANPVINAQSLVEFRTALMGSGHTSIDSFLATNATRPGFPEIGKLAMANILLPLDLQKDFMRGSIANDWMSFLFANMLPGCLQSVNEFLTNNRVSFVTFNYDRTLEHFLCVRLRHTYNISYPQAWQSVQELPIVHVYGPFGVFDPNIIDSPQPAITPTAFKEAATSIRLMHDDRGVDRDDLQKAKDLISAAECVCFLGFGFDPDNITHLQLNERCQPDKLVLATRYRVADGDWNRIRNAMTPTRLPSPNDANPNWDSLELMHQTNAVC